jgi:hypothetical protein
MAAAISRRDLPSARSRVILARSCLIVGRPSSVPLARAFRNAARTLSAISDRSSSAILPEP